METAERDFRRGLPRNWWPPKRLTDDDIAAEIDKFKQRPPWRSCEIQKRKLKMMPRGPKDEKAPRRYDRHGRADLFA